jgi:hypothetical protein
MCEGKYNPFKYFCDCCFYVCNNIGKGEPMAYTTTRVYGSSQPRPQAMMRADPPTDFMGKVEVRKEDQVIR